MEQRRRAREERKKMRDLEESGGTDVNNTNRYKESLSGSEGKGQKKMIKYSLLRFPGARFLHK